MCDNSSTFKVGSWNGRTDESRERRVINRNGGLGFRL